MAGWRPPGPPGNHRTGKGFPGHNRPAADGGPSAVQRSSAAQLKEQEPLFSTYEHLAGLERGDAALTMLRKVASVVKPIMRKHGWRVQVLAEFLPAEANLLGLNINKGYKICVRLRYHNNPGLFLPFEQVVDTMLHELSHNVWSDHDSNFHKLWDELRDEHEVLVRKGYTGEGFLGSGTRLGGNFDGAPPPREMRRLARASAEKRKQQGTLSVGSGKRLGGTPLHAGRNVRQVIADQVTRRNVVNKGCGSNRVDATQLSQASNNTFKTQAEEDDANNRAIAQALFELMEQEEEQKLNGTFQEKSINGGLDWSPEQGLYDASSIASSSRSSHIPSEEEQLKWAMEESRRTSAPERLAGSATSDLVKRKRLPRSGASSPIKPPSRTVSTQVKYSPDRTKAGPVDLTSVSSPTPSKATATGTSGSTSASPEQWVCNICTLVNPLQFLSCDACGIERPQSALITAQESQSARAPLRKSKSESKPANELNARGGFKVTAPDPNASLGWICGSCSTFMEHKWWTCSSCGRLKPSS